jgi:hypothetical protein
VNKAIDNLATTKYLNWLGAGSGLTFLTSRQSVVSGIALTSGNDVPQRDPTSYQLLGSNDTLTWVTVSSGAVPAFTGRRQRQVIDFTNTNQYRFYRLIFPTIVGGTCNNCNLMQISEVELLGCVQQQAIIRQGTFDIYGRPADMRKPGVYWRDGERVVVW